MLDDKRKESWKRACNELAKLAETEFYGEVKITAHQGLFCDLYITDHIKLTRLEKLSPKTEEKTNGAGKSEGKPQ